MPKLWIKTGNTFDPPQCTDAQLWGRSIRLAAEDLIQVLLAVADEFDPPMRCELVAENDQCPGCGQRDPDMLVWQDDDTMRCASCGTEYQPGA